MRFVVPTASKNLRCSGRLATCPRDFPPYTRQDGHTRWEYCGTAAASGLV